MLRKLEGSKPIGNISEGNLGSPLRTQFTYFDLIGLVYDPYVRTCSREKQERREWGLPKPGFGHRVLQSYTGKSPAAINVLAVLVRVGNQLRLPASVYGRIRRNSADSFSTGIPLRIWSCSQRAERSIWLLDKIFFVQSSSCLLSFSCYFLESSFEGVHSFVTMISWNPK